MNNVDNDMFGFGENNFNSENVSNDFSSVMNNKNNLEQLSNEDTNVVPESDSQYFGSPMENVSNNKFNSNFFDSNIVSSRLTNNLFEQSNSDLRDNENLETFGFEQQYRGSSDDETKTENNLNKNTLDSISNSFEQPFGVDEDVNNSNEEVVEQPLEEQFDSNSVETPEENNENSFNEEVVEQPQEEQFGSNVDETSEENDENNFNEEVVEQPQEEQFDSSSVETPEENNKNSFNEEVVDTYEENVETTERTGVITMSDTSEDELKKLTQYDEPDKIESTDIKALFDRVGINVKEASDIFRKNTEMKEKLDNRFEELKKLQSEIQKSKKVQNQEIDMYKNSVLEKLNDKKEEIEKRLNKLKEYQSTLEKEKEKFEAYKRAEKAEIAKVQREVQEAYDVRREELNHIEDVLRKQKDALDEERNQLSLDRIQYESDKNELANNLLKFNEIVDSFTNGMDKIGKE